MPMTFSNTAVLWTVQDSNVTQEYSQGFFSYLYEQSGILCNPVSLDNLRAVLCNENASDHIIGELLQEFVERSKTDNGQAITILLQDRRAVVKGHFLQKPLRKSFPAMVAALLGSDAIKKSAQQCAACSTRDQCWMLRMRESIRVQGPSW